MIDRPILRLNDIEYDFVDEGQVHPVFSNFNLNLKGSEFLTILGPSGCGKSTLLKLASSIIPSTQGDILFEGEPVYHPDNQRIMVFQDQDQLFPWLTVEQNAAFPLKIQFGKEWDRKIVSDLLKLVGLEKWKDHYPSQLSGGMKQRVALARALSTKPKILLMDEPFGSLDAQIRRELQNSLLEIFKKQGISILFVTHDIQEAVKLGDRIVVLSHDGNIVMESENLLDEPRTPENRRFPEVYHSIFSILS